MPILTIEWLSDTFDVYHVESGSVISATPCDGQNIHNLFDRAAKHFLQSGYIRVIFRGKDIFGIHFGRRSGMDELFCEAMNRFYDVLERAKHAGIAEPCAMSVATADTSGRPSVRMVLLRGVDERGFVFFTDSESRKGQELAKNPRAALCFYWDPLHEQVRVEGSVQLIADDESDAYWSRRSRDSQLSAWASNQFDRIESRSILEGRVLEYERRFANGPVPRPPHWLGYRVVPDRIEFWKSQPARLHERTLYELSESGWVSALLSP
jgi:pyridoxamine 5'-phosphate oxidase